MENGNAARPLGRVADQVKKLYRRTVALAPNRKKKVLTEEQARFWDVNGYLVLPAFYSLEEIAAVNEYIERVWRDRKRGDNPIVIDVYIGTPQEKRVYLRDTPEEARLKPYKINDLFLESQLIRDLVLGERLADILRELQDGDPLVCNSLTFERGSQQDDHFDTFYMPPPAHDKLVATWVALEDIVQDAGPLQYYPGSHKIPPYKFSNGILKAIPAEMPQAMSYIRSEIQKRGLKPETFIGKAGDVFIWHGQLFHGGTPINNINLTRASLVSHYFRAIDVDPALVSTIGPGRHFLKRSHQTVVS